MPRRHFATKHVPYEHKAPCDHKQSFKSEVEALKALERQTLVTAVQLKVYKCPYCAKWHLSSSSAY